MPEILELLNTVLGTY